jgi:hypothetical protein
MGDGRQRSVSATSPLRSRTRARRIRGHAVLALAAIVLARFTGLVLASTTGFERG